MKNILIIEDNPQHLADAKKFFASIEVYNFRFASSMYEAFPPADRNLADCFDVSKIQGYAGVISDFHFPERVGGPEFQLGVAIAWAGSARSVPVVIVSDQERHNGSVDWFASLLFGFDSPSVRTYVKTCMGTKDGKKRWDRAWRDLVQAMER